MMGMIKKKHFAIKFVLPILLILGALLIISAIYLNSQNNLFFLTVYEDSKPAWKKINKNMQKVSLGTLGIFSSEDITSNNFRIEGKNIKSVSFESPDSVFVDFSAVRRAPDLETKQELISYFSGSVLTVEEEYIYEAMINWNPDKLTCAKLYGDYGGDYTKYLTDIFTVTVIFDDGQIMKQVMEITVDENTGKTFVQRISVK